MTVKNHIPTISVVMPIYNATHYVHEAVSSILTQDFYDFELLLIDDGSTDNTVSILETFIVDTRVRILRNKQNIGLIATLHRAYNECKASLIARMDADDICKPGRFSSQVSFLQRHPDIDIIGGAIRFFGNTPPHIFHFPLEHSAIHAAMLFYCPLAHPALMFRQHLIKQGLFHYEDDFMHAEDYHLWSRLLLKVKAANLHDVILDYRLHPKQVSSSSSNRQYEASLRVRQHMLQEAGITLSEENIALHESIILEKPLLIPDYLVKLADWFNHLESANEQTQYWNPTELHNLLKIKFKETVLRTGGNLHQLASIHNTSRYISFESNDIDRSRPANILRKFKSYIRYIIHILKRNNNEQ